MALAAHLFTVIMLLHRTCFASPVPVAVQALSSCLPLCILCRQKGTAPPVWMPTTDSICNDVLEKRVSGIWRGGCCSPPAVLRQTYKALELSDEYCIALLAWMPATLRFWPCSSHQVSVPQLLSLLLGGACVQLGAEDLEERQRRKQAWEENKASLEQKLKAPWEQRTSGRGAAGRQRSGGSWGGGGGGGGGAEAGVFAAAQAARCTALSACW